MKTSRHPVALTAISWPLGRAHRRVDRVARAERLAAALAGAMARGQRIGARLARLHGALALVNQAVADGERALLVELELLHLVHRALSSAACDAARFRAVSGSPSAVGPDRRALPRRWISRAMTRSLRSRKCTPSHGWIEACRNSRCSEAFGTGRPPRPDDRRMQLGRLRQFMQRDRDIAGERPAHADVERLVDHQDVARARQRLLSAPRSGTGGRWSASRGRR